MKLEGHKREASAGLLLGKAESQGASTAALEGASTGILLSAG